MPVGLIAAYFGGASIESFTNDKKYNLLKKFDKIDWFNKLKKFDKGFAENWMKENISTKNWKEISLPAAWNSVNDLKGFKGTVWLRKKINIPENRKGKTLIVQPGVINDYDIFWLNGKEIGMMQWPWLFWIPRH